MNQSQWCCGCEGGMKIREQRNSRNQHFIPYAICGTIVLHLAHSVWGKWSRMVPRLKPAPLISWPAWEPLRVFVKCCKQTQIPETQKHLWQGSRCVDVSWAEALQMLCLPAAFLIVVDLHGTVWWPEPCHNARYDKAFWWSLCVPASWPHIRSFIICLQTYLEYNNKNN